MPGCCPSVWGMRRQFLLQGASALPAFPACLEECKLLIPSRRTRHGSSTDPVVRGSREFPSILGEFDDAALMKVRLSSNQGIFMAPTIYRRRSWRGREVMLLGETQRI